jgi:ribosomal protein S18 acetylase RimI-like enzyme
MLSRISHPEPIEKVPPHIRELTPTDASKYQRLRLLGLRESPTCFSSSLYEETGRSLSEVAARLTPAVDGAIRVFGSFSEKQLVGMVTFLRPSREKLRHCAELCGLYVAPEFRRGGRGGALVDTLLGHARSVIGVRQVKLTVTAANTAARALYRSRGFICCGSQPAALSVNGRYYDEELFILPLTAS